MKNDPSFTVKKLSSELFNHFREQTGDHDGSSSSICCVYVVQEDADHDDDFECAGDEVLVESSPPSPSQMAARLATPAQSATAGSPSPGGSVRELIVIPEIPNSVQLQHAIQQVSNTVVKVNGDSSGHSSPSAEPQHAYITVASESGNGVNYHVQYVDQELYAQGQHTHMETLRTYPVYNVADQPTAGTDAETESWAGPEFAAYGVVVQSGEGSPPGPPPRMPPATVQWLHDNYETADGVSLPRSTLYAHYLRHCTTHRLDPVNAASFGKLIRSVFIGLRTRRLGTRGNSKYHYYGIRAKPNAAASPQPADTAEEKNDDSQEGHERESLEPPTASPIGCAPHRQYLGAVTPPEPPELTLTTLPDDVPPGAPAALRRHYREHGAEFLEAVAALDTDAVERARRQFWRRPPPDLCRRALCKLAGNKEVAQWLHSAELALHQRAVDLLLPHVLSPIPPHLTQSIRNFAKSLESALSNGSSGAPAAAAKALASAAAALAAALRRYTSLNHLAQAARAVLTNSNQIQQMQADLNRVDFRVVREQAAWACSCGSAATARRLEADFKATLGRGATLEQWAAWLEACVRTALAPHERRPDYSARARRLLLDWSFYSSLVIRELTLRSAASFGSFHLIRLLYDEYVAYLIERRVAAHERTPPIAVMHRVEASTSEDESSDPPPPSPPLAGTESDPDWEWGDDDEDDDEERDNKRQKIE